MKANDFTGKTVIPFCSLRLLRPRPERETLAQLAGTGNWQEGQRWQRAARSDVADWLTGWASRSDKHPFPGKSALYPPPLRLIQWGKRDSAARAIPEKC